MRCEWCRRMSAFVLAEWLNPGPPLQEVEEMDLLPQAQTRRCQNIKSRKNPDVQCPFSAIHGDYCARHYKNPNAWVPRAPAAIASVNASAAASRLQRAWRRAAPLLSWKQQGPAANDLSVATNDKELYSFEPVSKIPRPYLFSFADERKNIWIFDIRTLVHYMGAGTPSQNPYTREQLSEKVMARLHARIAWLRSRKYQIVHVNTDVLTPEQLWNQKILDSFLKIEALGYYVNSDWFRAMRLYDHQAFYQKMFNLWEWRLGLSNADKERVVPGHMAAGARRLFKFTPDVNQDRDRGWWERNNLSLIESFIGRAADKEQQKLGAMYILMGLVQVSRPAAAALPWVVETVYA